MKVKPIRKAVKLTPIVGAVNVAKILQYLKCHGELLDSDIAKATGISIEDVRSSVAGLAAAGEVITCQLTRFEGGKRIDGWLCRVSGYIPPASPGRKSKAQS